MAALNPEIIKDTKILISLYQKNSRFKTAFDSIVAKNINATYHGRPVKLYVEVLKNVTSKYKQEYSQIRKIEHDTEGKIRELFQKVDPDKDFRRLDEAYEAALKGKNILDEKNIKEEEIEEINKTEEKFKKDEKGFIDNKGKREEYQTKIEAGLLLKEDEIVPTETEPIIYQTQTKIRQEPSKPSLPSVSSIPSSSGFKQFISSPKSFFRGSTSVGRAVATGTGKAIGKMGIGTAVKAGAGAAAKLGAKALLGAATGGVSLIFTFITSYGTLKDLFKLIFWIVIGLIAFIIVMFVFQRGEKMNSLLPPYDVPTMDSANGDISSCKFYRANEPASYKSSLLLSYISEASSLTGIPPAVLAAFIRVESPSSVNMSDDQIKNYTANCAVSKTGALGIMQIQPPGTTSAAGDPASCVDCIDAGAKLLGKNVQDLTRNDYCDPRTNIIIGSGWILKKMNYLGYTNTGKWNPVWTNDQGAINSLVFTYYGCLKYGGEKECTGPYDYGKDVWTSIQGCHLSTPLPTIKPGDYCGKGTNSQSVSSKATVTISDSQLQSVILQQFNIKMDEKFTPTNLRWAYEKFADISDTNFLNLATKNGPVTVQRDDSGSEQESPNLVRLKGFTDEAFFKTILLHELGHIIYNYRSEDSNQRTPHDNSYFSLNQGVTAYGTGTKSLTCYGAKRPESENYPEMLTYYLNPRVTELTYMNNCPSWGKLPYGDVFTTGRNKEYYSLAYKILCQ